MERSTITTPRLRLAPSAVEHADSLWSAVEASLPELRRWMPWASDDTYERNRDFLTMCENGWAKNEAWTFTIFEADRAAGTLGLASFDVVLNSAELGYWLRSDLTGRGYMTEAAAALVEFGFGGLKLHRIELRAGVENYDSNRVAEKVGFQRGGVLRDGSRGEGGWYDCYAYDLLETDARPRFPSE
ncbi:MAG: GNAT family N-acetyltransferase [Actinomycetota bacterium]|nr:GNAT family N-acetyltransferase [Actinomycetota bacterium]